MQSTYGPSVTQTYQTYSNKSLIKFIDKCTKYVSNLSPFLQYCLWRYTIGSASINSFLIFDKQSDNSVYWTKLFFQYHYNTFGRISKAPKPYDIYTDIFNDPKIFDKLTGDQQLVVADDIVRKYIITLLSIIQRGPRTTGEFRVFKVSSKYPALPDILIDSAIDVLQQPFNSTTISPYFNFAPFISPESTCCLFDILVPSGSMCLYIPTEFHAYPFEYEILLPPGVIFKISSITNNRQLHYVDKTQVKLDMVQDKKDIHMGPVFMMNEYHPCGSYGCFEILKNFMVYDATLES